MVAVGRGGMVVIVADQSQPAFSCASRVSESRAHYHTTNLVALQFSGALPCNLSRLAGQRITSPKSEQPRPSAKPIVKLVESANREDKTACEIHPHTASTTRFSYSQHAHTIFVSKNCQHQSNDGTKLDTRTVCKILLCLL